jgi:hypothetical protein
MPLTWHGKKKAILEPQHNIFSNFKTASTDVFYEVATT